MTNWLTRFDADDKADFFAEMRAAVGLAESAGDASPIDVVLAAWKATAVALSDPDAKAVLTGSPGEADFVEVRRAQSGYCRRCGIFTGYGGAGVIRAPKDRAEDREWLGSHCWSCGRSRDEIAAGKP